VPGCVLFNASPLANDSPAFGSGPLLGPAPGAAREGTSRAGRFRAAAAGSSPQMNAKGEASNSASWHVRPTVGEHSAAARAVVCAARKEEKEGWAPSSTLGSCRLFGIACHRRAIVSECLPLVLQLGGPADVVGAACTRTECYKVSTGSSPLRQAHTLTATRLARRPFLKFTWTFQARGPNAL
jgi:hypothetical protein